MIEFVVRDLLEKKLKNKLDELYEKNEKYGDKKVSVKMTSDYDDASSKSKIDLIVEYEDTEDNSKNKYV
jgi:hypothetical protein